MNHVIQGMNVYRVTDIANAGRDAVQEAIRCFGAGTGVGVYLCVAGGNGIPLLTFGIGTFSPEDIEGAMATHSRCILNAMRLSQNPTDLTSFESSGSDLERGRGAVRFGDTILSLFGFTPELMNETVVLAIACRFFDRHKFRDPQTNEELTVHELAQLVAKKSGNAQWLDLARAITGRR